MAELKPCPFCGGEAAVHKRRTSCRFYAEHENEIPKHGNLEKVISYADGHKSFVYWKSEYGAWCTDSSCLGRTQRVFSTEADAIEAWNRRADNV